MGTRSGDGLPIIPPFTPSGTKRFFFYFFLFLLNFHPGLTGTVANSELTETCLQCLCTLAVEASHFNFSTNVIGSVVTRVCRKSWDKVCFSPSNPAAYKD